MKKGRILSNAIILLKKMSYIKTYKKGMKGGKRNMNKLFGMFILAGVLLTIGFASADAPEARCGVADLCTWTTDIIGSASNPLPLGSGSPSDYGCGLSYNTLWPAGSEAEPTYATATCVFDGNNLADVMLYVSVDNDIVSCTLNGGQVIGPQIHEGCAPLDPRIGGYSTGLSINFINSGTNTLICEVKDRGGISHFDACVTGTKTPPIVPEFGLIAGITTILGALGTFFVLRRK